MSSVYVVGLFGSLLQSTYLSLFLEQYYGKNYTQQQEFQIASSNHMYATITDVSTIEVDMQEETG